MFLLHLSAPPVSFFSTPLTGFLLSFSIFPLLVLFLTISFYIFHFILLTIFRSGLQCLFHRSCSYLPYVSFVRIALSNCPHLSSHLHPSTSSCSSSTVISYNNVFLVNFLAFFFFLTFLLFFLSFLCIPSADLVVIIPLSSLFCLFLVSAALFLFYAFFFQ